MPKASEGERARVLHEPSEQIETVCSSCNRQPYDRDLYFSHDDVLYATPEMALRQCDVGMLDSLEAPDQLWRTLIHNVRLVHSAEDQSIA